MTLSASWHRSRSIQSIPVTPVLWLLCCIPLLHVALFPLIQDTPRTFQGFAVQSLRPIASLSALLLILYVSRRQQGRRRWAWGCVAVAIFFSTIFGIERIVVGTAAPTPLTKTLPLLIYLFALAGTALYIEPHAWWLGSTARALLDGIAVGYASLLLLQACLPLLLHNQPWNPQVGIILPYLALDMGILFAVGAGGLRYGHSNRPFVVLILFSLLCLMVADGLYLWLAWVPWGQGKHWLLQPLFSLQAILLAFGAARDVNTPTLPPIQQVPMPLREWLFWALVPEFFLLSTFFVIGFVGTVPPLMRDTLFGIALVHALLAEFDRRRVLHNLFQAETQIRQTNNALAKTNDQLQHANHDLAQAHADAQIAAETSEAFIARLIHDLAPPVQGLTTVILGSRWPVDQAVEQDIARRQLRLLETFVHQARTYLQARTVNISCTLIPLLPLCRTAISTVRLRAQQRGIRLIQEVEAEEPMVRGDEVAILRILG